MQTYVATRPPIFVTGVFNVPTSYSFLALRVVEAFCQLKIPVAIDDRCKISGDKARLRWLYGHPGPSDVKMWVYPVCQLWEKGIDPDHPVEIDKRTILFTMWEAAYLKPQWVELLNRSAMVVVPCQWNAVVFQACGVKVPVRVVPLGCDTRIYHPLEREIMTVGPDGLRRDWDGRHISAKLHTFGAAGAVAMGGWRKNLHFVPTIFQRAFPTEQDVRLQIKVTPNCRLQLTDAHKIDDRIEVIDRYLDEPAMANWYRGLDAFVSASSGEGFGLHLLEAMACGVPLISLAYSGEREFFDGSVGYVANGRLALIPPNDLYEGAWVVPEIDDFAKQMRQVYDFRVLARQKGVIAAQRAKEFSWERFGEMLAWEVQHCHLEPAKKPRKRASWRQ